MDQQYVWKKNFFIEFENEYKRRDAKRNRIAEVHIRRNLNAINDLLVCYYHLQYAAMIH